MLFYEADNTLYHTKPCTIKFTALYKHCTMQYTAP